MEEETVLNFLKRHGLESKQGQSILAEKVPSKENWLVSIFKKNKQKSYCINFSKNELVLIPLDQKTNSLKEGIYNQVPLSEIKNLYFEKPAADNKLIVEYQNDSKLAEHYFIPQENAASPWHSRNMMHLMEEIGTKKK
ncbi:hypothetical protein SAMN04488700_1376 [Carnobacterium iners]|uniref:Uncharacterized protein n=1 Tax=Carnobacterium iners TaxID=1073423 RepID=A0A1X7N753_9LACT|nr:hypothetical protein [Carnobacterium iners]SEK60154.1 hypothetical protein SAMN04488114_1077 [Carnobacterium iners]SMH32327.1 hypothetical protein SAMN04488700_1376 [Carnobacterium iners]